MKVIGLFFLLTFCLFNVSEAQTSSFDYDLLWKRVYRYELRDLPQSANAVVDSIYLESVRENHAEQRIKSLIYKSKFMLVLEEEAQVKVIALFKKEIESTASPTKNLLQNILANIYWQYYQSNRWRIRNRTATDRKEEGNLLTWDANTLLNEVHRLYQLSLTNTPFLQTILVSEYDEILIQVNDTEKIRPTLFDFLAHNALDFYQSSESRLSQPTYQFKIDDPRYFELYDRTPLATKDSLSFLAKALEIYSQLLELHLGDDDPTALVSLELQRLEFLKENASLDDKKKYYRSALTNLREAVRKHEASALVAYQIASFDHRVSAEYEITKDQAVKLKRRDAVELCQQTIEEFGSSFGGRQCAALLNTILKKDLSIKTESYVPTGLPSRILLEYKNMDNVYFHLFKASNRQIARIDTLRSDSSKIHTISNLSLIESRAVNLVDEGGYYTHTTEVAILPLKAGPYYLVASKDSVVRFGESLYSHVDFQVTNIALIKNTDPEKGQFLHVLNRKTGSPLARANIDLSNKLVGKRRLDKKITTREDGIAFTNVSDYHYNVTASVSYDSDTVVFKNQYLSQRNRQRNKQEERVSAKAFLFTDRSIYRPGQKVYFKGILVQNRGDESDIVPNEFVEVYLDDVNGEEVGYLRRKTNKYGSFSGEFRIPESGLTGEYNLYVEEDYEEDSEFYDEILDDFEYSDLYISVEEYKRPTFEVTFDAVKETYRVDDTVTVSGLANAFSGATLSNAAVSYKVKRNVRLPRWYYWGSFRSEYYGAPQEIAFGEMEADEDGTFEIKFPAVPDSKADKKKLPTFEYLVEVDVTDINGETRSASFSVKAGYHSLDIAINNAPQYDLHEKEVSIPITTNNLNGQPVETEGVVSVYLLSSPDHVKRDRPWESPDYPLISKEEFEKLFPYDYYTGPDDESNKVLVKEYRFDTSNSSQIIIDDLRKWKAGKYLIEAKCKDPFGEEVMTKSKFDLIDFKKPGNHDLFFFRTDKNSYEIGDEVEVSFGTASRDLTVIIEVEKEGRVENRYIKHLNNEIKKLKVPVTSKDHNGFVIHYYLVNHNSFENGSRTISISNKASRLSIETKSFRDKILPGSNETWSFMIKGEGKEQVEAEVVASMYDASLDQFKSHDWAFNPFYQRRSYYSYSRTEANSSFITKRSQDRNYEYRLINVLRLHFTEFDWFGFNMGNNRWLNRRYLERIAYFFYEESKGLNSTIKTGNRSGLKKGMIYGIISDELGQPIPGVTIVIKGTIRGAVTDVDGQYSILAEKGDELVFSFIGYKSISTTVGKGNVVDVALAPDINKLSEVVVTGYGMERSKQSLSYSIVETTDSEEVLEEIVFSEAPEEEIELKLQSVAAGVNIERDSGVYIRGNSSIDASSGVLYVVDGVIVESFDVNQQDIQSVNVLKGDAATAIYGARGANGVVVITTKAGQEEIARQLAQIQARKNFNETAFFYPHLSTDKNGNVTFSFTTPESLTRWKLNLLAHTSELQYGAKRLEAVSQKDLMVVPNPPRFLRQKDEIEFSAKITNLSADSLSGFVALQLTDAVTGESIDAELGNVNSQQNFNVAAKNTVAVSWRLAVPENMQAVQYRVVAKAGDFTDGEQNVLPVLSNRLLVTETLPMNVKSNETKTYELTKLKNNTSSTLSHHQLTLEVTSNPAWYAIKSLPYLIEFPYECAEQTFSRYYSNVLAGHILHSNSKIKEVFDTWALNESVSTLEKNANLKSIIINETPWLRDAQSEVEQQKRLAELFDLDKLAKQKKQVMDKLIQMQFANGGLPWFSGSRYPNRYITQHVATGFGHLQTIGIKDESTQTFIRKMLEYLDGEMVRDYKRILKNAEEASLGRDKYLDKNHLSSIRIQYLYMKSFFEDEKPSEKLKEAITFFKNQSAKYWVEQKLYMRGMIALTHYREGSIDLAEDILKSLKENSIVNEEQGRYWKAKSFSWRWDESPVETQALLIEAFSEIELNNQSAQERQAVVDELKLWLLKQKQTNHWSTTKSTTEAIYALLLKGSDWLSIEEQVAIQVGEEIIDLDKVATDQIEAGSGYFNTSWVSEDVRPELANVQITKKDNGVAWGAMYWQYFEDLNKITPATTPLKLTKKLFIKKNTAEGKKLFEISDTTKVLIGDLITVRIELTVDRDMDFVHMKDMRVSGFEPINVLSAYKWQDGLGYYESTRDASTNFFFEQLGKGTYVFEYDLRANNKGVFSNGITTIQSMYAPEFSSHSEGRVVVIE